MSRDTYANDDRVRCAHPPVPIGAEVRITGMFPAHVPDRATVAEVQANGAIVAEYERHGRVRQIQLYQGEWRQV